MIYVSDKAHKQPLAQPSMNIQCKEDRYCCPLILDISFHFISLISLFHKCGFSVGNPKNLNRKTTTMHLLVYLPDLQKYKIEETVALFIPIHGARGEKEQNKLVSIIGIFLLDSYHQLV